MKINIFQNDTDKGTVVQMLQTINAGDEVVIEYSKNSSSHINTENIIGTSYLLITTLFLGVFFMALLKIKRLKKKYPETKIEGINFIATDAKGTPFSFLNSIFWNIAIDLHSKPGQQIFNHEIAHVKEKHSYDKIFMNIVLIFFWVNPFFWLMRKELNMIHEFIADKKAVEDNDINAFAEMILQTVYPGQRFSVTNNFFYSPLKRRILMLTKNKNPRVTYLSRLLVLPLMAFVFFAFTLKLKTINNPGLYSGKTITVVIDAGHGGADNGAISPDGLKEKDINLSIAKKIAELNSNDHIKILLSRDNDELIPVKERVEFAKTNHSDLFISIHVNAADNNNLNENGFSVLIDKNNTDKNKLFASALINELKKSYTTDNMIGVRQKGVWVLDSNVCPAALIECGYLTNPADEAFIINNTNQEKIARNILDAVNSYATDADNTEIKTTALEVRNDTIPEMYYKNKKIKSISVIRESSKVNVTFEDGTKETISEAEAKNNGLLPPPPPPPPLPLNNKQVPPPPPPPPTVSEALNTNALYIENGKIISNADAKKIDSHSISEINVLNSEAAIKKYGDKAKNGAVELNTKVRGQLYIDSTSYKIKQTTKISPNGELFVQYVDTLPNKLFTKVENEAEFPGGKTAWLKYISSQVQKNQTKFTNKDFGTCIVKFVVNTDGNVSHVEASTMKGTALADVAINAIKDGPNWIPAKQNNHVVASYRLLPVTYQSVATDDVTVSELKKEAQDKLNGTINEEQQNSKAEAEPVKK